MNSAVRRSTELEGPNASPAYFKGATRSLASEEYDRPWRGDRDVYSCMRRNHRSCSH